MSKVYLLKDTLEVFAKNEDKHYFFGLTTEGSVRKNVSQELIRAGLNSKVVGVLQVDDGMEVSVTTGLYYKDLFELQTGTEFKDVTELEVQKVVEDEDGTITVTPDQVTGEVLELEAGAFGKNVELQLHTIAVDPETNEVVCDIYWIFPNCTPDGNLEQVFGMGTNNVQTINFTPKVPRGETSYGQYIIVPRA